KQSDSQTDIGAQVATVSEDLRSLRALWSDGIHGGMLASAALEVGHCVQRLARLDDPATRASALTVLGLLRYLGGAGDGTSILSEAAVLGGAGRRVRTSVPTIWVAARHIWRGELARARSLLHGPAIHDLDNADSAPYGRHALLAELECRCG